MIKRLEFSRKIKLARWQFCGGRCEAVWDGKRCDALLTPGKFEYHHEVEAENGGDNSFYNCRVVDLACHKLLTKPFVQRIRKADRQQAVHLNAKASPSRPIKSRGFAPSDKSIARKAREPKARLRPKILYD
jgi:hypothetical protein